MEGTCKIMEFNPLPMQAVLKYNMHNRWLSNLCLKTCSDGEPPVTFWCRVSHCQKVRTIRKFFPMFNGHLLCCNLNPYILILPSRGTKNKSTQSTFSGMYRLCHLLISFSPNIHTSFNLSLRERVSSPPHSCALSLIFNSFTGAVETHLDHCLAAGWGRRNCNLI